MVPPEVTLKLSEWISVGVSAMFTALTATGLAISLPEIWMSRPARVPFSAGLSAAPCALMSALICPFTVVPGAKAMPAAAARRAISAMETLLAFRFRSSCAGVGLEFIVPVTESGVGPSLMAHLLILSRSFVTSSLTS